ncbi:MAG: YegS/Rv2252/BmrU family lipid kinase [Paenibacillaceae bacterium]
MIGFVVNPASGNGRGRYVWRQLEEVLQNREVPYLVRFTTGRQDAEQFAMEWAIDSSEVTIIVAVGGDGTVHEVANGLYRVKAVAQATSVTSVNSATSATSANPALLNKPLGHIPAGSGNDYARGHQIPLQPLLALEVILSRTLNIRCIDLIKMNDRIAVNSIGVGFDGRIARVTNEASYKKLFNQLKLGRLSYVLSLVRVLLTYRTCSATLAIDGKRSSASKVWFIATANIPFYGGGMKICPQADPESGQAEICIVSSIHRIELLRVFPKVYKGTHIHHKAISFYQGRIIEIDAERPLDIHMDGEMAGTSPVTLEVLPAILSIIVSQVVIKQYDVVRISKGDSEIGIIKGQVGTILEVHNDYHFEVEICDSDGFTLFLGTLSRDCLEPI